MDPARWERIQDIFHATVDRPADEQRAFLNDACEDDEDLAAAVQALLDGDARGASLLDRGVGEVAQQVLGEPCGAPVTRVGHYTLKSRLGEGGMGVVYLAEREDLGSRVAIKLLRDAWVSPARRERFALEQRTLAQLSHPSIARLYDADTLADGTPWFAMEYVEGLPLTDYCRTRGCTADERLRLFQQVCEAVRHAHSQLIVHRDLKPSNILVAADGSVKLLDFGIAKQLESMEPGADQTRTLLRLMTPAYAAPEQIRGEPATVQTDVYALGVILYELVAGRRPFDLSDRTPGEAVRIGLQQPPDKPSGIARASGGPFGRRHGSRADLDLLCLTAMYPDRQRRYASAEALIRDIGHYLKGEPLDARGDSLPYRAGMFLRRNWRGASFAAGVAVAIVGLTAFYTVRLTAARNAALAEAARTQRIQRFMLDLFKGGEKDAAPAQDLRVVTLVDRGVQEARSLAGDPGVQAELYQTLGTIYQKLGSYDEADRLLQAALDQRVKLFGRNDPEVSDTLVALGLLRVDQAQLTDAQRLVQEALENVRRALPPEHPAYARATAAMGRVLRERGKYDEAVVLLDEAVRLYSTPASASGDLTATMTALANTHFYAGRLDVSEALNQRVLEADRRMYGDHHPSVADDLINLGAIRTSRSDHAEAGRYYRQALDIIEPWYGSDHPETASAKTILAQALLQQSHYDEATALLRQALATQERVHGPVHPRVAFALNELGMVALRRSRLDEAEAAFARTLEIYRTVYAGKHSRVGVAMANLASVYLAQEELARAERLFGEAIELYSALLPADHLNIGIARSKLGRTLVRQRRYKEAERELLAGLSILLRQAGPSSSWLRTTRADLVTVYDALEQPEKAEQYRTELAGMISR
jgi:serine/threonine-protein kinase